MLKKNTDNETLLQVESKSLTVNLHGEPGLIPEVTVLLLNT